jgi:hypothetical protein
MVRWPTVVIVGRRVAGVLLGGRCSLTRERRGHAAAHDEQCQRERGDRSNVHR